MTETPQFQYQVRFDWGLTGAQAIAPGAHAVIWVDQLGTDLVLAGAECARASGADTDQPEAESQARPVEHGVTRAAPADTFSNIAPNARIIAGSIQNSAAVASWVLDRQAETGERFIVSVVAAGAVRVDGSPRWAVEDLLGAGAVVDELAAVGIDASSPEAAAACAAYTGLRRAAAHLISASETGLALGMPLQNLDPTSEVHELRRVGPR